MTVKTIITEPNKLLRQVSKPVYQVGKDEQKVMDILQTDLVPSSLLCIGYPKQTKFPKPRRNLKDLVNVVW